MFWKKDKSKFLLDNDCEIVIIFNKCCLKLLKKWV